MYPVIADPPLLAGTVNATVACVFPFVAVPIVGAPGTVEGVTEFEAELAGLLPLAFVANTVKVYAVPLVSPVTVIGLAEPVAVILPGVEVTVYPVIPEPVGAVKVTVACAFPAVATTFVGTPSCVVNVISFPYAVPALFVAYALIKYITPGVNPERLLTKLPVPVPSVVKELVVVGPVVKAQQTPLAVISPFPSDVIFPPEIAVVPVTEVIVVVVRDGISIGVVVNERSAP